MIRRAVVAGGAGFLGSHLCERLLASGFEVVCLDNYCTGSPANIAHLSSFEGFSARLHDVTEPLPVEGPVHVVFNMASPASPIDYARLPIETLLAGAMGTRNCLELAKKHRARFVLASTSEVYGDPLVHPQPETYWGNVNPVGPRSVYDEAKRYAEALTTSYREQRHVNTGIARIFNCYGPRLRPNDGRAIPTFIWQALHDEALTVTGDGTQTRSACFVDDLVDGLIHLMNSEMAGPVNLGNPEEVSVLELAGRIRVAVGTAAPIEFVPRPPDDPSVRRPDISLAGELLGWQPTISLDDGLKRTIEWFRDVMDESGASGSTRTGEK